MRHSPGRVRQEMERNFHEIGEDQRKTGDGKEDKMIRKGSLFTLIELLIVIAIIAILLTSESIFFMSVYVNGVLGKA